MMINTLAMLRHSVLPLLVLLHAAQSFQTQQCIKRGKPTAFSLRPSSCLRHPPHSAGTTTVLVLSSLDEELPKFSSDVVPEDDDSTSTSRKSNSGESSSNNQDSNDDKDNNNEGLLTRLNDIGQSLKPKAQEVDVKAGQTNKMKRKIGLKAKACFYWMLYIAYRGYRGFFVILPAVFGEVYRKMETAVDFRVLDDNDEGEVNSSSVAGGPLDVNPSTGKVRWRTRITVSVLAGIVTLTYVIGGLARVLMKFVKTILRTSSLSGSFSAAAEEVEGNESRLMRLGGDKQKSNDDKGGINGRDSSDDRSVAF